MIVEEAEVWQRVDGGVAQPFRKEVLRLAGDPPRFVVRKRALGGDVPPRRHPVLLVHGFGQNRRAWHLSGRSFANHLAAQGFDVFNTELRGHGRSRRAGTLAAHDLATSVDVDLPAALDVAAARSGRDRAFVVGHSLGGLLAYALAAGYGSRVAGVVTLGAPLRFGADSATLALVRGGVAAASRAAPGAAFPMGLIRAGLRRTAGLWDLPWLPIPLRAWAPGAFEATVRDEYLRDAFDVGTLGQLAEITRDGAALAARWARCDVPALVLAGTHDLLAPPSSVHPGFSVGPRRDRTWVELPFGHGDIILGRDAPARVWPLITRWLVARDGEP